MDNNAENWQHLFHQLLSLAQQQATKDPQALALAKSWESFQNTLDQDTDLAQDYHAYYASTSHDTRDNTVDLVDQQKWYDALQTVQLFVQDVLREH